MPQPKSSQPALTDADATAQAPRRAPRTRSATNGHTPSVQETINLPELLAALTALKRGDFSVRLPVHWTGLAGKTADTFNEVVELNERMAREFARLRQAVGREGRIGQRASLGDVTGTWADSVGLVNELIADLVQPTSEMARVIGAVAKGDLSQTMAIDLDGRPLEGEFLRTARTVNTMVDQLGSFASEVTRVAREVGTEGKLGGQADVRGVAGTWKDLTDSVNLMASNLTGQVRNIAEVTTAVANGDLAKKITADVKGEFLELKDTINTMVDQLRSFASEVTRVAREVGTEGKLGGQADVRGVSGTWKDLTDSVNSMASNLTGQVRNIAEVTTAVAKGDLSRKITVDVQGEILELKNTINTMVDQLNSFASEVTRVAREVGSEGKLGGQADVRGVAGTWKDLTDSVNSMAGNLTAQVRNIADVTTAVANGDLAKKITVDVRGEILELKNTINTMVDQLGSFASEVTRVAREVGTEGKLGGQARVEGVSGTWRDLTDNVNSMAGNLTAQVRNIADVTTAVAKGDLSKKITVDVRGEISELKNHHQHDGRSVEFLRCGGNARGARGRQRGQTRRSGGRARRLGHVEGSHRQREFHGRQPDFPGAQHRRGHHGRRQRRSFQEDHRGRARGNSGAEEHDQHDGGSARLVRLGSDPRGARGRHGRQARRPGAGSRRGRHVERPDRQREFHGERPDLAGAQHRRGDDGGRQRRPFAQDHGGRARRNPGAEKHHQHDGRSAQFVRLGSHPRGPRGRQRRASSAARPMCAAFRARGKISPTA